MAGDWIKWCKGLADRREVAVIASRLKRDNHEIAGRLMVLWEWADDNFGPADIDPDSQDVSLYLGDNPAAFVDALLGLPGMAEALASPGVGWIEFRSGGRCVFPALARHNGTSAKTRAYEARKKADQRKKAKQVPDAMSPKVSPKIMDKTGTREEREKSNNSSTETTSPPKSRAGPFDPHAVPIPKELDMPGFREAWTEWIAYRATVGKALTERSIQGQFRQMIPYGVAAAVDAINRSIASQWIGLFPEKEVNRGQRGGTRADRIGPGQSFGPDQVPAGGAVTDF